MNKEWSELNKTMQTQISKKDTYEAGIETLFELRNRLMKTLTLFNDELDKEGFNAIPFINADGYHSKTIAYSIWHIFRILVKQQIADFSKQLDLKELYSYIFEVKESTEKIIKNLSYAELKRNVSEERKEYLKSLNVISNAENAIWLVDY